MGKNSLVRMLDNNDEEMFTWTQGLIKARKGLLVPNAHAELFQETFQLWLMVAIRAARIGLSSKGGSTLLPSA